MAVLVGLEPMCLCSQQHEILTEWLYRKSKSSQAHKLHKWSG